MKPFSWGCITEIGSYCINLNTLGGRGGDDPRFSKVKDTENEEWARHRVEKELQGQRKNSSAWAFFLKLTEGKERSVKIVPAETLNLKSQTETLVSVKGRVRLPGRRCVKLPRSDWECGTWPMKRGSGKPVEKTRFWDMCCLVIIVAMVEHYRASFDNPR